VRSRKFMKATKLKKLPKKNAALTTGTLIAMAFGSSAYAQTLPASSPSSPSDPVVDALIQKGILTQEEAEKVEAEIAARQANFKASLETNVVNDMPISRFKMPDSIKSMELYGDFRLRYEYRSVDNVPGATPGNFYRERFRYALRVGIRGNLFDDWSYGIRLETANNPRSPWDTFGNNTTSGAATPSDKNTSGIYLGQAFLSWHPTDWYEMTAGRMPMPLYTTPMVWDSDINPEGAFEKFKFTVNNVDLFVDFAQFDYQDPGSATQVPSSDTFVLAWQAGAKVNIGKDIFFKIAPMLYTYTGDGTSSGLNESFVGQGSGGVNIGVPGGSDVPGFNEQGINNLLIMEIPAEYDFKIWNTPVGTVQARLFGDFAYNFQGNDRANAAFNANPAAFPGLSGPVDGQNKAYQAGIGFGSAGPVYGPTQGLVYGSTSKKNTWEARMYYQHIEQYALDVNLLDSDFFEGRANLQGFYSAFAYSFTDAIIGTIRYGYANQIKSDLGTGGNNLDIPGINPIKNYNLLQLDLTWRF
jgi:Putative porin